MTVDQQTTSPASAVSPVATAPSIRMRGLTVLPRVTAAASAGALSVLEQHVEPGAGSPPHRCTRETKVITVLEGSFLVIEDFAARPLEAGESVVIAPGVRHNFANTGDRPGRILVTLTPGGHEEFLRGLAAMGGPANADPVELAAHCSQHGVELCA